MAKNKQQFTSLIEQKPSAFELLFKQKAVKFEPFLPSVLQQIKDYETIRNSDN